MIVRSLGWRWGSLTFEWLRWNSPSSGGVARSGRSGTRQSPPGTRRRRGRAIRRGSLRVRGCRPGRTIPDRKGPAQLDRGHRRWIGPRVRRPPRHCAPDVVHGNRTGDPHRQAGCPRGSRRRLSGQSGLARYARRPDPAIARARSAVVQAQRRASPALACRRYRRGRTRGRRSSRGRPSLQAAQPTRSGRCPNSTNARSARLGPAWRPRSVRKPLAVVGSRAADGATRPCRPLARIRRASPWQSSYVVVPPISVEVPRRGRARGGRGSSIDQIDRATPARSAGAVISSCLRNSAHAPSGVSAK